MFSQNKIQEKKIFLTLNLIDIFMAIADIFMSIIMLDSRYQIL